MGGLSKKAFQFKAIAEAEKVPFLTLDAGSLLFKHAALSVKQAEQEKITAFGIVRSYNLMGYDAVGVTMDDLIAGPHFLREVLAAASTFPWLSANLIDRKTGSLLFPASVVLGKGELSIGVFALTSPLLPPEVMETGEMEAIPWQQVMAKTLAALTPQCDLIILLSNLSDQDNHEIANQYPAIKIIIQAGAARNNNMQPVQVNKTLICQTGQKGKQIGIMTINWQGTDWGTGKSEELKKQKHLLDRVQWQLSRYQDLNNPANGSSPSLDAMRTHNNLIARKQFLENTITRLSEELASSSETISPSTFTNRFMAMQTSLPDHEGVLKIIEETNRQINELGKREAMNSSVEPETDYIGSHQCGPCHGQQLTAWQTSAHARAYTTLLDKKQQFNLDCLPCHITGNGDPSYVDAHRLGAEFQGVGCENCHGPGRQHQQAPAKARLLARPPASICLGCHTDERDDAFDYENDVRLIAH